MSTRRAVLELRLAGLTYAEIATQVGVSPSRVGQIVRQTSYSPARVAELRRRVHERAVELRAGAEFQALDKPAH